jgi:acetyl esterase/lipase
VRRTLWLLAASGLGAAILFVACSPITALNLAISRDGYRIEKNIAYGTDPRQKLDLYIPNGLKTPAPVLLFFYGGSWENGTKDYYLALGEAFAAKGIVVAIADYRVYPQVKYPAFIEDGASALGFVHSHVAHYGGDPKRVFVSGHSAGAYIAIMLAVNPAYHSFDKMRAAIGISGPYDFLPLTDPDLITIFGGDRREDTQPIQYVDGKRPPMLLVTGADDTTVSPGNTARMAAKLRGFGSDVETRTYPHTGHIGIILSLAPGMRWSTPLREDIVSFIAAH